MPSKRSCLGWGVFFAALIGFGFALDAVLPPAPRLVLRDPHLQNIPNAATLTENGDVLITNTFDRTNDNAWVQDPIRTWDAVTGRERGQFFRDLFRADPSAYQLEYSPGRRYGALVHARGMVIADLLTGQEWPTVLTWENARQGPRHFSPLYRLLQAPISTSGLQGPMKLKDALEILFDRSAGKLQILVNLQAFVDELGADAPDLYEEEVNLPQFPKTMPAATALRMMLAQIGKGTATYIVRRNYIEVTTRKHYGEDLALNPVFSPRGSFVAVAEGLSHVFNLHIVECATGRRVAKFPLHAEKLAVFGFTPDEELLYFFAAENGKPLFTVWNTRTKQVVRIFKEIKCSSETDDFLLAPDGRTLLVNPSDSVGVELFHLGTGERRRCFTDTRSQDVGSILFSPDGRTLIGHTSKGLHLWDLAAGKCRGPFNLDRGDGFWPPLDFVISADGRVIAAPHEESGFTAWSLESGERLWPPKPPKPAEPVAVQDRHGFVRIYPHITPDHRLLVNSTDGCIDLLDPATGAPRVSVVVGGEFGPPGDIRFTPDSRWMLSTWGLKQNREPWFLQKWLGKWWPFTEPLRVVMVTEIATGRTVFRLDDRGVACELSDNGGTLMTYLGATDDAPGIIACYDVPGRPSRYAVLGIPLALAFLGIAMYWWFTWRKHMAPPPTAT